MHGKKDIETIITDYITANVTEIASMPTPETFRKAAKRVKQGRKELRQLKLSDEDKKHLPLLQAAFMNTQKGFEAGARLKKPEHDRRMRQANKFAQEYERRLTENGNT